MANSLCGKYQNVSLDKLSGHLLEGIKDIVIIKKSKSQFRDRLSIRMHATGKIDGVTVSLLIQTFKKDHCTYDFALISTGKDLLEKDFESFLSSLQIR